MAIERARKALGYKKRKAPAAWDRIVEEEHNDGEAAVVRKTTKAVTVSGNRGNKEKRTRKMKRREQKTWREMREIEGKRKDGEKDLRRGSYEMMVQ